ncbi:BREX-1 system adenine-specific DNA-methyltransferase PglX [Gilvibacter sp.]|uniref:BREX-1 system adenine-specific DNA-methyltransferase PglX n=1 Tax=Gilvibacter sp. TaxID=2729997 RepID=UPI003B51CC1C
MNTKTFAQQARNILMDGVAKKLLYWGFDTDGSVKESPQAISGGYSFRGEVFDDPNVPQLWTALKKAIEQKGIEVVVEEAAYTWFNRMMAIRILAKNGYDAPQLQYAEGLVHTPVMLQKARQGQFSYLGNEEQSRLKKIITDYTKDQEAFALLLTGYCHSHKTLNRVFGSIDDYTELLLPDDMLQDSGFLRLLNTTDAISDEEYQQVELIGWLYQYYISEKKDEVFASFKKNKKAEAKDIPAATQIFTPNWIVKYMVENTAGKIWLDKHPDSPLKVKMKYLVENEADGTAAPIIKDVEELTLLDPACGSGHILVEGFDLLYQMYMEEYYSPAEAVETIFEKNLFGLDIDNRAAQLSNFAILLKAAKVYPDVWDKDWLPQVYAMPEAQDFSRQELKDFLGVEDEEYLEELEPALRLMKQSKNLGSVMKLKLSDKARSFIQQRFESVKADSYRDFNLELVYQKIQDYIPVLILLTQEYTSVVANPPYMGQKSMNGQLKDYVGKNYPMTKGDLMTIFMEVIPALTSDRARFSLINLPSWLFLSSFEKLRKQYIEEYSFDSLLHMGRGIFGIDFGSVAFAIKKENKAGTVGTYFKLHERNFQHIHYRDIEKLFLYSNNKEEYRYDFGQYRGEDGITEIPKAGTEKGLKLYYSNISQTNFSKIPGSPIAYWVTEALFEVFQLPKIKEISEVKHGMSTGKNVAVVRTWSEVSFKDLGIGISSHEEDNKKLFKWFPYNKGGAFRKWFGNHDFVLRYDQFGIDLMKSFGGFRYDGKSHYFKEGITWSFISSGSFASRYTPTGFVFDVSGSSLFLNDYSNVLGFLNSKISYHILKILNPTINFQVGNLKSLPVHNEIFDNNRINYLVELCTKRSKLDWDARETSWNFEKSRLLIEELDLGSAFETWAKKVKEDFFQLHSNEEELNRIFIDIYGLQEELTPEVALKDITILQEELDRKELERLEPTFREQGKDAIELPIDKGEVISQFISYAVGLFMGRYRLDKPGLNIAHPNPTAEELASYKYNGSQVTIDEDAILPLMGKQCNFPDDVLQQFQQLLDTIWGGDTRTENINFIQECLNKDLGKFLVKDFYKYHCKMYKKKPIYWLFASPKGAFQVLVYMHRMNAFTVEKIRANYLLEHIKNLRSEEAVLMANESSLSTQEAKRLDTLRKQILECEAYDMHLKDVADQQIEFDLDDGVAVNYKKFEAVVAKIR